MYCLVRCVRLPGSIYQGFNKWLFGSSKLQTVCTRSMCTTRYAYAFGNEKKFLLQDKLTPDYELIYRLQSTKWWVYALIGSYIILVASPIVLALPYVIGSRRYYKPVDAEKLIEELYTNIFNPTPQENIVYCFICVFFNAFIYLLIKRYPLRIYYNGKQYVAIYRNGFLPLLKKRHYFEKARRTRNILGFLPDSNFRLGTRDGRLFATHFRRPIDFEGMLVTPYYEPEEEES